MAIPVLEFITENWVEIPQNSDKVRITILAKPPVAVSAGFIIFTRPIEEPNGETAHWRKIRQEGIDNIPGTTEVSYLVFDVSPGNFYTFKQQGEAHLLMPGYEELTVGFLLDVEGKPFHNYGGQKTADARAAGIIGMTYLKYGV